MLMYCCLYLAYVGIVCWVRNVLLGPSGNQGQVYWLDALSFGQVVQWGGLSKDL